MKEYHALLYQCICVDKAFNAFLKMLSYETATETNFADSTST